MPDALKDLEKKVEREVEELIPTPLVLLALTLMALMGAFLLTPQTTHRTRDLTLATQTLYAEVSSTSTPLWFHTASLPGSINVPILVYHIVRPSYPDDSPAIRALAQTPDVFDAEMQYLHDAGYHVISFTDLENHFTEGDALPLKPIILSFDDGWKNQVKYALPLLKAHQYTATFFVFTNAIGNRGFMTWDDLHTLLGAGMTIASHSLSHPYLTHLTDPVALENEIVASKRILEEGLGITVNEFAYPFGQYNQEIIELVKKAGYRSARGDFYSGEQSPAIRYALSALNAPTNLSTFKYLFP